MGEPSAVERQLRSVAWMNEGSPQPAGLRNFRLIRVQWRSPFADAFSGRFRAAEASGLPVGMPPEQDQKISFSYVGLSREWRAEAGMHGAAICCCGFDCEP